jgi:ribosomal protein S27E
MREVVCGECHEEQTATIHAADPPQCEHCGSMSLTSVSG